MRVHGIRLCLPHKLRERMDNALALVEAAFRQTTLAEVLAEPTSSHPFCELPPGKKPRR